MHQSAGSFLPGLPTVLDHRMMTQLNAVQSRSQAISTRSFARILPGFLRQFRALLQVPTVVEWRGLFPNLYQVDRSVDGVLYLQRIGRNNSDDP
jgi:hypothetical protein